MFDVYGAIVNNILLIFYCVITSCLALNDLLRGRPLDDVVDQLPELWDTVFRVMDDIKVCFFLTYCI